MARQRKLSPERKEFINGLLQHYQPKTAQDIHEMLRDLLGDTLQGMLEAELDTELGYSKYDYSAKETDNSRNCYSKKNVISSMGEISLDIPRDRKGDFEPQIVKRIKQIFPISRIKYFPFMRKECTQEISQLICTVFME